MNIDLKVEEIKIKIFLGKIGLNSIVDDWQKITSAMPNARFYHSFHWYKCYIDTIEDNPSNVYFFTIYRGNNPIAIFPLKQVIKKNSIFKFNVLEIPNHDHISLSDFICCNGNVLELVEQLVLFLKNKKDFKWDYIIFPKFLEDSPSFMYCKKHMYPYVLLENIGKCNYLTNTPYKESSSKLSKNFKSNLRKSKNKLMQTNQVKFISEKNTNKVHTCFKEFLEVEASGWKGTNGSGTAIKINPKIEKFYEVLTKEFAQKNECLINLLKVKNIVISGQFCLVINNIIYVLKIGYNEKFKKMSPGHLLLDKLIEDTSKNHNIKQINLITDTKWHSNWNPSQYNIYRMTLFNKSYKGLLAYYLNRVKIKIKNYRKRNNMTNKIRSR